MRYTYHTQTGPVRISARKNWVQLLRELDAAETASDERFYEHLALLRFGELPINTAANTAIFRPDKTDEFPHVGELLSRYKRGRYATLYRLYVLEYSAPQLAEKLHCSIRKIWCLRSKEVNLLNKELQNPGGNARHGVRKEQKR